MSGAARVNHESDPTQLRDRDWSEEAAAQAEGSPEASVIALAFSTSRSAVGAISSGQLSLEPMLQQLPFKFQMPCADTSSLTSSHYRRTHSADTVRPLESAYNLSVSDRAECRVRIVPTPRYARWSRCSNIPSISRTAIQCRWKWSVY